MTERIVLASDHGGFDLKKELLDGLIEGGYAVTDLGTHSLEATDYADYAHQACRRILAGEQTRGILICGTGIGMCIAANKVRGVRAAPCQDIVSAEMSRRHNDANVLCLSADLLGEELIGRIVRLWLETEFEGGRHARRVEKITRYEAENP